VSSALVAVVAFHNDTDDSLEAASRIDDAKLRSLPIADSSVFSSLLRASSCASGRCSTDISALMIELTSRPLPMPMEVMFAMSGPFPVSSGYRPRAPRL
jgi:hypothetical protein